MKKESEFICINCNPDEPCILRLIVDENDIPTRCPYSEYGCPSWEKKLGSGSESRSTTSKRKNWREHKR
jgi:hypothetical protein